MVPQTFLILLVFLTVMLNLWFFLLMLYCEHPIYVLRTYVLIVGGLLGERNLILIIHMSSC